MNSILVQYVHTALGSTAQLSVAFSTSDSLDGDESRADKFGEIDSRLRG